MAVAVRFTKKLFSPTTNDLGLVNLQIGAGTPTLGTFSSIDWSNGTYFIETAVDVSGRNLAMWLFPPHSS